MPDDVSDSQDPVVAGFLEPGYPSVGYLAGWRDGRWRLRCGAALISPTAAVTAAHCIFGSLTKGYVGFGFGVGAAYGGEIVPAVQVLTHPEYQSSGWRRYRHDVAVLLFDRPIPAPISEIVAPEFVGAARYVGYGRVSPGDSSVSYGYTNERKSAGQELIAWDGYNIWTRGTDGGLCWGDSGGALMAEGGPQILGVLADFNGDFACYQGNEMIFTSLAGERYFIDSALAAAWR